MTRHDIINLCNPLKKQNTLVTEPQNEIIVIRIINEYEYLEHWINILYDNATDYYENTWNNMTIFTFVDCTVILFNEI